MDQMIRRSSSARRELGNKRCRGPR
jgi:hypothetical protein